LVGIICEFSGLESVGPEAGDGSAGTEFFDLVRLAIRGFVVGNWPSFAYNHAPRFSDYVTTLLLDMGLVTACPGRTE
jgi:hypothetical protein